MPYPTCLQIYTATKGKGCFETGSRSTKRSQVLGLHSLAADRKCKGVCCSVAQLCPTLCNPMDCGLPGSSLHGILQIRVLERVSIPSSRGSSQPRDQTPVSWHLLHWQVSPLPLSHQENLKGADSKITAQGSSSFMFSPLTPSLLLFFLYWHSLPYKGKHFLLLLLLF